MTTQSQSQYRGITTLTCPMWNCKSTFRFRETEATLNDRYRTQERRETYLRLAHEAGHHRVAA
jgi:hypothetical protein